VRMDATEVARRFLDSFRLHDVVHEEELEVDSTPWPNPTGPTGAAGHILRAQAAAKAESDFEDILNARAPGQDVLEHDENVGLLLALFITGRRRGGDVAFRNSGVVIGDHRNDVTHVTVEVGAKRSDFTVEFLVRRDETGPHPDWHPEAGDSVPDVLTLTRELALIREDHGFEEPHPSDQKTRRHGLASLGMMVMAYTRDEAGRDPFGLARRALDDLERATADPFTR